MSIDIQRPTFQVAFDHRSITRTITTDISLLLSQFVIYRKEPITANLLSHMMSTASSLALEVSGHDRERVQFLFGKEDCDD